MGKLKGEQLMSRRGSILQPHEHDVLLGRGGKNNQALGNEKLREMARVEAENYRRSTKKGKSSISRKLVRQMRELDPPARYECRGIQISCSDTFLKTNQMNDALNLIAMFRFMKRNSDNSEWEDVGDEFAREKASQVLRDAVAGLPEITGSGDIGYDEERDTQPRLVTASRSRDSASRAYAEMQPTPTLQCIASSLPPPTPLAVGSRKRSRYSQHSEQQPTAYPRQGYAPHTPTVYSPPQYPYSYDHPGTYTPTHYSGFPARPPLPSFLHERINPRVATRPARVQNRDTSTASSLLGEIQEHATEFDLFNGELLASDTEEEVKESRAPSGYRRDSYGHPAPPWP